MALTITQNILYIARDTLFIALYVRTITSERALSRLQRGLMLLFLVGLNALMLLLATATSPLATIIPGRLLFSEFWGEVFLSFLRILVRAAGCYAYIRGRKHISNMTALYDALLTTTLCNITHNLFLTPATNPILNNAVSYTGVREVDVFLCLLVTNLVTLSVYYLIIRLIPLTNIKNVTRFRLVMLTLLALVVLYLNSTLKLDAVRGSAQAMQFSIYGILMDVLLLIYVAAAENYQQAIQENARKERENQVAKALLESIHEQKKNESLIRQMRHDLRNHLYAIRFLINQDQKEAAIQYIDQLQHEYIPVQFCYHTGSTILDGILFQKSEAAKQQNVAFSVSADFSFLKDMRDSDLCVLFGNLLDNALEACAKIEGGRFIDIRAKRIGETILYSIENSAPDTGRQGPLDLRSLRTDKSDKINHGIGTHSAVRVARKYGGEISFSIKENRFCAVCSFPVPLPPPLGSAGAGASGGSDTSDEPAESGLPGASDKATASEKSEKHAWQE